MTKWNASYPVRWPVSLLVLALSSLGVCAAPSVGVAAEPIFWHQSHLREVRDRVGRNESTPQEKVALQKLRKDADAALLREPYTVTRKEQTPPSGDKHDYMSFSRYWWPDPDRPDGLPYIRHDGRVNRTLVRKGDRVPLGELVEDVVALSLAGFLWEEPRYSRKASTLLKTWFLDESTRMNPHMRYGQAVPGRAEGRGVGIIDTRGFIWLLDAQTLLGEDSGWTAEDRTQLQAWFREYLHWLQQSDLGKKEQSSKNNHGSWYEAQVACYAIFAGEPEQAADAVRRGRARVDFQFDAEGKQPAELVRTRSLHYSFFNLTALMVLARAGERVDTDLWEYQSPEGVTLRKGIEYLLPFAEGKQTWPYPRMEDDIQLSRSNHATLRLASVMYDAPPFAAIAGAADIRHGEHDFSVLVVPASTSG